MSEIGGEGDSEEEGDAYSPSGMPMSMNTVMICLDEAVSVAGVEDLESSWVITGMATAVKGTSR